MLHDRRELILESVSTRSYPYYELSEVDPANQMGGEDLTIIT